MALLAAAVIVTPAAVAAAPSENAGYWLVSTSDSHAILMDRAKVLGSGPLRTAETLSVNLKPERQFGVAYSVLEYEFSCSLRGFEVLYGVHYRKDGSVSGRFNPRFTGFRPVRPGSNAEVAFQFACVGPSPLQRGLGEVSLDDILFMFRVHSAPPTPLR